MEQKLYEKKIMKIELKNVKFSEAMSEETNAFTADIYADGKKIGYAKNQGHGGSTDYHHEYDENIEKNKANRKALEKAEDYCAKLPQIDYGTFKIDSNLENQIDLLFEAWLSNKDKKKTEKKLAADCEKGLCYGTPENYSLISWKGHTMKSILQHPKGREALIKAIMENKIDKKTILNKNIPEQLLK